jgi:hypothetical protein
MRPPFPQVELSCCPEQLRGFLPGKKRDADAPRFARRHRAAIQDQVAIPRMGTVLLDLARTTKPLWPGRPLQTALAGRVQSYLGNQVGIHIVPTSNVDARGRQSSVAIPLRLPYREAGRRGHLR